jgi:hypothetical protein
MYSVGKDSRTGKDLADILKVHIFAQDFLKKNFYWGNCSDERKPFKETNFAKMVMERKENILA